MELEERVADLERQLMERVDVSVATDLSLAVENAIRASRLAHDSNIILLNSLKGANAYIVELNDRIRWLIDSYPGWDEEGVFAFPDGDVWYQ